jgi:hypothetical protein
LMMHVGSVTSDSREYFDCVPLERIMEMGRLAFLFPIFVCQCRAV